MTTKDPKIQDQFFYCPECGSLRVAGIKLSALNFIPDHKGRLQPTVSAAEIASKRDEVSDPDRYFCFCFECEQFHDVIYDSALLHKHLPQVVS